MSHTSDPLSVLLGLIRNNYIKLNDAREVYEVIANRMNTIDNLPELIAFLGQHLKPKELEKKLHGEVFTPPSLIQEKFDKLTEADPSIWSDPSKKFLDPANGIGNYPALAYHRLMEGLKEAIPDVAERKKHILENMLYMCELNAKNVEVSRKLFDPEGIYALNLYQGSFLDLNPADEWKVEEFDVVFGNPPYNDCHNKKADQGGSGSRTRLYPSFVIRSLALLKDNGFLVFIHPAMWRKPNDILHQYLFGNQLHHLRLYTKPEGSKIFGRGVTTKVDWYVLQKQLPSLPTMIHLDDNTIISHHINVATPMICGHGHDIWYKMYQMILEGKAEPLPVEKRAIANSKCKGTSSDNYVYPLIQSTSRKGVSSISWYKLSHPNQYKKKVVYAEIEVVHPVYDKEGRFGTTDNIQSILVTDDTEGEYLCRYLSSKLFQYIVGATKWSMFRTDHSMFQYIPYPKELPHDFTDAQLYDYFDFTEEEICRIESNQRGPGLATYSIQVAPDVICPPPEERENKESQTDYNKMKNNDLKQLCKERGITGISGKNKDALIAMLSKQEAVIVASPVATQAIPKKIKRPVVAK